MMRSPLRSSIPEVELSSPKSEYRLFLVDARTGQFAAYREERTWCLPRLLIPKGGRTAEQLQRVARDHFGVDIVVIDYLASDVSTSLSAVAELSFGQLSGGLNYVPLEQICKMDRPDWEQEGLKSVLSARNGLLSRPGWINEATEWIQSEVTGATIRCDGIRQFSAGGGFALVRFERKDGVAYWLKATGAPNKHEFGLTEALFKSCPSALPSLLAKRSDWNAWVMEEAGEPVDCFNEALLVLAATTLARLQDSCRDKCSELLATGAHNLRLSTLRAGLPDLIEYVIHAMEQQASTRVPRLPSCRLLELGQLLRETCDRMEELLIPDTLIHNDLNGNNLLYDSSRCVLIDWSEAAIGNPFLTFEHLLLLANSDAERAALRETYCRCWTGILSAKQCRRAYRIAPLLATASHLYGRGDWLSTKLPHDPYFKSYARSVARHMDRVARTEHLGTTLCS